MNQMGGGLLGRRGTRHRVGELSARPDCRARPPAAYRMSHPGSGNRNRQRGVTLVNVVTPYRPRWSHPPNRRQWRPRPRRPRQLRPPAPSTLPSSITPPGFRWPMPLIASLHLLPIIGASVVVSMMDTFMARQATRTASSGTPYSSLTTGTSTGTATGTVTGFIWGRP